VKWVETRAECLLQGGREQRQRFRVAYDDDGRVRALHDEFTADHGAMAAGAGWGMAFVGANSLPSAMTSSTAALITDCCHQQTAIRRNETLRQGQRCGGSRAGMELVAEATALIRPRFDAQLRGRGSLSLHGFIGPCAR